MNLTISIDDSLLDQARELASRRGTSVQELLRAHLEALVGRAGRAGRAAPEAAARELLELMETHGGRSGDRRITRDEAYEGRL